MTMSMDAKRPALAYNNNNNYEGPQPLPGQPTTLGGELGVKDPAEVQSLPSEGSCSSGQDQTVSRYRVNCGG
ncbi:unnamed protein product [Lota lota]